MTPTQKKSKASTSQLRIIAGRWRGRKLPIPGAEGLRPTGDRLRETLFNWLAPQLPGARCLDLFAGTGALGLEALSRGAASVTMLELQRNVAAQLRTNCQALNAAGAQVLEANAVPWLKQTTEAPFDVIFIDPPFDADLWQAVINTLEERQLLADQAHIYIEKPKGAHLTPPNTWSLHRNKIAGAVCAQLFIRGKVQETSGL